MKRALLLLLASGCDLYVGHHGAAPPDALQTSPADLDVLFVIDNSARMADKEAVLAENFTAMVEAFDSLPAGRPNLHVGFVSTSVDLGVATFSMEGCPSPDPYGNGLLQATQGPGSPAACAAPTGSYIVDVAGGSGRVTNYTGSLEQTMACIGAVGSTGCGFIAPLQAMKRALDGTNPANAGFLRDGAALLVVIVADRDDCSGEPALFEPAQPANTIRCVQNGYTCDQPISATEAGTYTGCVPSTDSDEYTPASYAAFLATIKNPAQTAVAVIAGDPSTTIATGSVMLDGLLQPLAVLPSCTATVNGTAGTTAQPADRIVAFAQSFTNEGFFTACSSDYSAALGSAVGFAYQAMVL